MGRPTLLQTEFEHRAEMYEDLLELLQFGFLAETIEVQGLDLSLRSLYPSDLYKLRHRIGPRGGDKKARSWLLAASVWMVDGQEVMQDNEALQQLYQTFSGSQDILTENVAHVVQSLHRRANLALSYVEPFVYEDVSRSLWRSCGGRVNDVLGLGFGMGYNTAQRLWVAHNTFEDLRDNYRQHWENAKLVASTMASAKAMTQLHKSDAQALEDENRRRQQVRDVAYANWRGLPVPDGVYDSDGRVTATGKFSSIEVAVTDEDLIEQMWKVRNGVKDDHDRVVDHYKEQVRLMIEQERAEKEARIEALRDQMQEGSLANLSLTPEAVWSKMQSGGKSTRFANPKRSKLYEKYIKNDPIVGHLQGNSEGASRPVPSASLQERVRSRNPQGVEYVD